MSRIDEALRRARHEAPPGRDGEEAESPVWDRVEIPSESMFESPWRFSQNGGQEADARSETRADVLTLAPQPGGTEQGTPLGGEAVRPSPGASAPAVAFRGFDPTVVERLVISAEARAGTLEQYRRLAGTLHQAQVERNVRTVMVSSALPGEGKTLTATNLALTLSESYRRRVLLIDADLRRPALHQLFQVSNLHGLNDVLQAETDGRLRLAEVSKTLKLLPAGRPDPDPLGSLTSPRMRQIVEEAAAAFDWVIVDTPPIGLLTDGHILAGILDATLLVIRAEATPYPLVQKAIEVIGRERIIGVVLNRARPATDGHYGDYYQHYERRAEGGGERSAD
ncbi:MAG: CpsD/CapB family tyrosine-protein kinase [Acidobacteria bacterium]|nr:CpsD/CapB family tyrosine-protein kinase [Acidobacteriota bacterium]